MMHQWSPNLLSNHLLWIDFFDSSNEISTCIFMLLHKIREVPNIYIYIKEEEEEETEKDQKF